MLDLQATQTLLTRLVSTTNSLRLTISVLISQRDANQCILILVQFTLYFTNKSCKNMLQKRVHFVQTGEVYISSIALSIVVNNWNPHVTLWWKSPDDERQMIALIQLQTQNLTEIVLLSLKCLLCLIAHLILRMKILVLLTGFLISFLGWLREFDGKGLYED